MSLTINPARSEYPQAMCDHINPIITAGGTPVDRVRKKYASQPGA